MFTPQSLGQGGEKASGWWGAPWNPQLQKQEGRGRKPGCSWLSGKDAGAGHPSLGRGPGSAHTPPPLSLWTGHRPWSCPSWPWPGAVTFKLWATVANDN